MKKIKKNIFGIGLGLAMVMGIGFGFVPQNVIAEGGGGNSGCTPPYIPCYSASVSNDRADYIDCSTCTKVLKREAQGVNGCCKINNS